MEVTKKEQEDVEPVKKLNLLTKEMIIMNRRLYLEYYDEDLSNRPVREISTGYTGIADGARSINDGRVLHYMVKLDHQSKEDSSRKWLDIHQLELLD